jgi:hypothetical protein
VIDVDIQPYWIDITVNDRLKLEHQVIKFPMYLPHELFAAVYKCGWEVFSHVFLGGVSEGSMDN